MRNDCGPSTVGQNYVKIDREFSINFVLTPVRQYNFAFVFARVARQRLCLGYGHGPAREPLLAVLVGHGIVSTVPPEVADLLESEPLMAHLGTCVEGRPHVAPVWYRYEDDVVELVTTGRKLENIRTNPRVSLSVQADDEGRTRWMVTLLGTATVIEDDAETAAARRRINEKYGAKPDAYDENTLVRVDVGSTTYETY